jgi:uncharacterized protein with PIN domain
MSDVVLRCYGDLADLAGADRDGLVTIPMAAPAAGAAPAPRAVKDVVESVGIPHTEVDLVLVDSASVAWTHHLTGGERVAVYPPWTALSVSAVSRVRPPDLAVPRFVVDVHAGTLARRLRLLGLDTWWSNDADDAALARRAHVDQRILLTRDRGLLMRRRITRGALLRSTDPQRQLAQVVRRYGLAGHARPRTRCVACNGALEVVPVADEAHRLEPGTLAAGHTAVARCADCDRLYWPGAHARDLDAIVALALDRTPRGGGR